MVRADRVAGVVPQLAELALVVPDVGGGLGLGHSQGPPRVGHPRARLRRLGGVPRPLGVACACSFPGSGRRQERLGRPRGGVDSPEDLGLRRLHGDARQAGPRLLQQLLGPDLLLRALLVGRLRCVADQGAEGEAHVQDRGAHRVLRGLGRPRPLRRLCRPGQRAAIHHGCRRSDRAELAALQQPHHRDRRGQLHGPGRAPRRRTQGGRGRRRCARTAVLHPLLLVAWPILPLHALRGGDRGDAADSGGGGEDGRGFPRRAGGGHEAAARAGGFHRVR
mmetsp:Transcript_44890/g.129709  ORF Transcript_44890/g.129709 Transcript_44890/m.129709 type:complete len:278 (+) Transcript_44890:537-1370(+)